MEAQRKSDARAGSTGAPRGRRPSRRNKILRRTAHLFLEKGYETTSMADIARATGISKAGLYYHFPRKQDLLAAIVNLAHEILEREVGRAIASSSSDEEALRGIIHAHARLITREDDAAFAILAVEEMRSLLPEDRAQIARRKRAYLDLIRQRLERLSAAGKLEGIDPTVATHTLSGMVLWLSKWYRPDGRLSDEQVANQIALLAMNAVLPALAPLPVESG